VAGVSDEVEDQDRFGETLTAGDFNGDGYDDLAVNVLFETIGDITSGAVNVLYGSSTGLRASAFGDTPDDQFWHQNIPNVRDSAEEFDGFGASLTSGDFNGDGYDDLGIGIDGEAVGPIAGAGAFGILYGSPSGLRASAAGSTPDDQFWHQDSSDILDSAEQGDHFGSGLSSGDFNGDGYDDLAIGAYFEDLEPGMGFFNGAANVLYGSSSGITSAGNQFWNQDSPGVQDTVEQDLFAFSLASGDYNDDGYYDLAIGVPNENVGSIESAGAVNVIYGSSAGLQATGTGGPDDQLWHQDVPGVLGEAEKDDGFGSSLA
jgi:hypothetical protein